MGRKTTAHWEKVALDCVSELADLIEKVASEPTLIHLRQLKEVSNNFHVILFDILFDMEELEGALVRCKNKRPAIPQPKMFLN